MQFHMPAMFIERKTLCPFSKTVLEQEKGSFICLGITDVYHCLLDERNRSGEICHQSIWVPEDYCPQYNTGANVIDVVPCTLSIGYPDEPFQSNEVYKYPVCLNKTCNNYRGLRIGEEKEISPVSPWIFATVSIAVLLILAVVCYIMCRLIRRKKKKNENDWERFLAENKISCDIRKTLDYLKDQRFSSSQMYKSAIQLLDARHCITIIGPPGSGKTITAVQLAYKKGGLSNLHFCKTVEEISVTAQKNKGAYIVFDDWIDEYVYFPSIIDRAINLLSSVYKEFVHNGQVNLILTAQEDKWLRFRKTLENCPLFQFEIHYKILTNKERQNMFLCHRKHTIESTERSLEKKIKDEKEFSFPSIIDLICNNERLRSLHSKSLKLKDRFSQALKTFFNEWLNDGNNEEKISFCVLIFVALSGGKVSLTDLKSPITDPLFRKVCNEYKCPINAETEWTQNKSSAQKVQILLEKNNRLRSCVYETSSSQNDKMFIFHHSSLLRFVLSYIKEKEELFFIENADVEVLMKQCWINADVLDKPEASQENPSLTPPVGSVIFSDRAIKTLTMRIRSEKEQGHKIPELDNHIFMHRKIFKAFWINS